MAKLLNSVESRICLATETTDRHKWFMGGGYFCICIVLSLRSLEGLLVDLEALIEHNHGDGPHMTIPLLLGRFKGEAHYAQHLMPCVNVTNSSIPVKVWMTRLLALHRTLGWTQGLAFINSKGCQSTTAEVNSMFLECLSDIKDEEVDGSDCKASQFVY